MKFTVAIPTIAGRERYLASSLQTCVSQDFDGLEILVSDNSREGTAREVFESFDDPRLRYVQPPEYLPMSAHWDFVVSQVDGEMLTIIGDDDGLMPGCLRRVDEIVREHGARPIRHSLCNYYWPDYPVSADQNSVVFFHAVGAGTRLVSTADFLSGALEGRLRYVDGPMVYHYFVPTRLVRSLAIDGVIFRRASPDVFSSLAIASSVDQFVMSEQCLTMSGQGARANGIAVRLGTKEGNRFMVEAESIGPRSRFRSKTVQLLLLDYLLEVVGDRRGSEVDYKRHLVRALQEARALKGTHLQLAELREITRVALEVGVLSDIAREMFTRLGGKLVRKLRPAPGATPSSHRANAPPERLHLPPTVRNIHDATIAASAYIDLHCTQ